MNTDIWEKEAIQATTAGAWQKAIELNQKIIKADPKNVPAFNRLARAFLENHHFAKAKKTYQKVLAIDQFNPIASKNLKRLIGKTGKKITTQEKKPVVTEAFLQQPRQAKIVRAVRLTSAQRLAEVDSGDEVKLIPKNRFIGILSQEGVHLGCLPEDLSQRLITFINGGNKYQAFVKTVDRNLLEIMVKEIHRSKRFANRPSF